MISTYTVDGQVQMAKKVDNGFLLMVERTQYEEVEGDEWRYNYKRFVDVILLKVQGNQIVEVNKEVIEDNRTFHQPGDPLSIGTYQNTFIKLDSDQYLIAINRSLHAVELGTSDITVTAMTLDSCLPEYGSRLVMIQDEFFALSSVDIDENGDVFTPPVATPNDLSLIHI